MPSLKITRRWLIAPALLLAFCSKGNSPSLTSPSSAPAPVAGADSGGLGISAAGDVKVGTGALEFLNLAIYGFKGDPGTGGFVNPGGTYGMTPGVAVRLWATYPPGSPANPKFRVDWGDGAVDAGGCGGCSATHTYARPGLYTVKASLDDRVSTMVTRTFQLDARQPDSTSSPTPSPSPGLNDTVRLVNGGTLPVRYLLCGSGAPGTCTAAAARTTCQNAGLKVVSHASDGSATVASLGASTSCAWSISYFTVNRQMPAGACLVGVSNLDASQCCSQDAWHGNTLAFGPPNTVFGYVHPHNSGYDPMNPNVTGTGWGCYGLTTPANNASGCTQQYIACTP